METRDRCFDFLNIFTKKIGEKRAKLCKNMIITLFFEKNANFFSRKLSKIAQNCDHNIDPCKFFKNFF
jgi:hypothetical protein